jgi:hypothetical protein
MAKEGFRPYALVDALSDMPDTFYTTQLAAHEHVLRVHFQTAPDRQLNTWVGDWLSHEGENLGVIKHPAHPAGKNDQLWQRKPPRS